MKKKIEARIEYWDNEIRLLEIDKREAETMAERITLADKLITAHTIALELQKLLILDES
jgi:hypothetical protein